MSFSTPAALVAPRTWTRKDSEFFISNDPAYISVKEVNHAFGMDFIYWAKPLPEDVLRQILAGSMSFGVYKRLPPSESGKERTEQVGLARMITDSTTFGYLSDTYVLPEYQGHGLGKWLFNCVTEVFSAENMPYLRRIMLLTSEKKTQEFYTNAFGVKVVGHEERPDMGKDLVFMCARPGAEL
ncbi:hypothetical protein N7495_008598 [Penicillium taxi]|uniref:uncharacterized protein n=1 Tax=Penicillium taxi TaxID=168475 RepID=UPI0025458E03|nr:uncharacterized protein N7495_008598 [Penicillium taxi]KAJ5888557.1 hypothetical protein N7495_008598 [Penicillium taxi]